MPAGRIISRGAIRLTFAWGLAILLNRPCAGQLSSPSLLDDLGAEIGSRREERAQRTMIFFPPVPPPLDRPIMHLGTAIPSPVTPPAELAAYVNESFYAPLGSRLAHHDLTEKLRQRLDAYHSARTILREELHTELTQTRDADPTTRQRALETLARRQAPRLAELEKSAEELRAALITDDYDWNAFREWRLGDGNTRGDSPFEVAQVMRAYAFYHKGLDVAHRGLLREISMEFALATEDTTSATAAQPFMFFSPEPARVQLPDDLPAPLAALVAEYQTKKSALKKELYDAVRTQDRAIFLNFASLRGVAKEQTPRLVALEQLAEEIRRGLAALPPIVRPGPRSPLPPVLTARIADLLKNRTALQKETIAQIEQVRRDTPGARDLVQLNYSFDASGLKFSVQPRRQFRNRSVQETQHIVEVVSNAMAPVAEDYGRRFVELANETDAIRREVTNGMDHPTNPQVDAVLNGAARYAVLRDNETAYHDYRTAVFQPGLSPEQRRLLFGDALEQLDLPLMRGELQPATRGGW